MERRPTDSSKHARPDVVRDMTAWEQSQIVRSGDMYANPEQYVDPKEQALQDVMDLIQERHRLRSKQEPDARYIQDMKEAYRAKNTEDLRQVAKKLIAEVERLRSQ